MDSTAAGEQQVLARVCIKLCSKPCQHAEPTEEVTATTAADAAPPKRAGLAAAGKNASIKSGTGTGTAAAAAAAGPGSSNTGTDAQPRLQHVMVSLSGLDGLQQELPAATGSWVQVAPGQSCQCLDVSLPDTQLVVSEQRVRSWAAAAAQLSVNITVTSPPAADAAPKKAGAAGTAAAAGTKAGAAPAAAAAVLASGSLTVNCAGLLTGDCAAWCQWGSAPVPVAMPVTPAAAAEAVSSDAAAAPAGTVAQQLPAAAVACDQQSSAAGHEGASKFKWAVQPPSGTLRGWLESAEVVLQVFKLPATSVPLEQHTGAKAAAGKPPSANTAAAASTPAAARHSTARLSTSGDTAAAAEALSLEPCSLLSPELAAVLNPIVLYAQKATSLPDAPATRQQLDGFCEPVKLRVVWPAVAPGGATQTAASTSPWANSSTFSTAGAAEGAPGALAVRTATFAAPVIVLGCDVGQQVLTQLCRSKGVELQVHDRTALPEPAPFTAARMQQQKQLQLEKHAQQAQQASGAKGGSHKGGAASRQSAAKSSPSLKAASAAAAPAQPTPASTDTPADAGSVVADGVASGVAATSADAAPSAVVAADDGEVFAAAWVSLLDLVRGRSSCCFALPLRPVNTLRGRSCLDWKSRPGRYLEANSVIKGWVRAAVPPHVMQPSVEAALASLAAAAAAKAAAADSSSSASAPAGVAAGAAAAGATVPVEGAAAPAGAPAGGKAGRRTTATHPTGSAAAAAAAGAKKSADAAAAGGVSSAGPQPGLGHKRSTAGSCVPAAVAEQQQQTAPQPQPQTQLAQQQQQQLPHAADYVMLPSAERFQGHIATAVFVMDYRDSDLLHVLEDSVRQHNAMALGLAPPPPPTPEQLAAAKAAEAAAAAAAEAEAAAAAAAVAAAAGVRGRPRPSSAAASAAKLPQKPPLGGQGSKAAAGVTGAKVTGGAPAVEGNKAAEAAATPAAAQDGVGPLASKAAAARRLSGGATQATGTPRSILKQPPAAGAAAGLAGEASAGTSGGLTSSQQQQHMQHPRASFAGDLGSSSSPAGAKATGGRRRGGVSGPGGDESSANGDESSDESEEELSQADQRLQAALQQYEHVELDQRLLQVLSTYQLSQEQVSDAALDVLTGFQLVDGDLRLFVLEGPAGGAGMQALVPAVARWALEDQEDALQQQQQEEEAGLGGNIQPQQQWLRRQVLFNPSIRSPLRRYGSLGVDVWMLKLHASLAVLGASASTFTGHVRPECLAGMKCLLGMVQGYLPTSSRCPAGSIKSTSPGRHAAAAGQPASSQQPQQQQQQGSRPSAGVVLMRQLDACRLLPSAEQLHLMDKKFGGELSAADVLGVEAEADLEGDDDNDSEADAAAAAGGGAKAAKAASTPHTGAFTAAGAAAAGGPKSAAKGPTTLAGAHAAAAKAVAARMQLLLAEDGADVAACVRAAEEAGAAKEAQSLASRRHLTRRSGRGTSTSRKSRRFSRRNGRRSSMGGRKKRAYRPKHALDMDNSVYLHLRMEAHRRREQRDITAEHLQMLAALCVSKQPVREAWRSWNPQRAAAEELQRQVESGALTLEDALRAHYDTSLHKQQQQQDPSHLDPVQAKALGWCPHPQPFMWPAPRDPASYNTHDLKPSDYRIEELQEPWAEAGLATAAQLPSKDAGSRPVSFDCLVRPSPTGLFTQDPGFWQSVHIAGDAWEEQLAQKRAAEAAEAASKVVVKDVHFHGLPGTGDRAAAQADRLKNLLKGQPAKKGFKVAHVPPPPVSMYTDTPWEPSSTTAGSLSSSSSTKADKTKWLGQQDFNALCNKQRSALAKPGFSDASTAALADDKQAVEQAPSAVLGATAAPPVGEAASCVGGQ